jgi:hypothetical protein
MLGCACLPAGLGLECFADFTTTPLRDLGLVESEEELAAIRQTL